MESYIKQHEECKQVSLTGARALIVLVSLLESPKSFEEIREFLINCGVATKMYSIDTIRIDLNTLKAVGCQISKAVKSNNNKYHLLYHPFKLRVSSKEILTLKEVYKRISKTASPYKILEYHYLFQRFAALADTEDLGEELAGISLLKGVDIQLVEELVSDEKKHNRIRILYVTPENHEFEYDITLEKLGIRSNKLYVYCFNHTIGKRSFLNVSRIKKILCKVFDRGTTQGLDTTVNFILKNVKDYLLEENETIIEEQEGQVLIEGRYFNEFIAIQRILSFGPDAIVMEPKEIKKAIIKKLKGMRSMYG